MILIASQKRDDGAESDRSQDAKIAAHRAVLAAACPYFSAMFSGAMKESKQESIFLKVASSLSISCIPHSYFDYQIGKLSRMGS